MLELTEKEKKLLGKYYGSFVEDPLEGIAEGLVASYYSTKEEKERKEAAYEYTKRLLIAVAEKRGLIIDNEETFEIEDMIINDELKDFNLDYYKDYNLLKEYAYEKSKNMNAEETEELYNIFGGQIGSMQDNFREFMTNYIPEILDNIYSLNKELEQDEEILEYPSEEDWVIDNDEEDKQSEAENILSNELDWESDDEWEEEYENHEEVSEEKILGDENLIKCIKFLNSYSKLITYKGNGEKLCDEFHEIVKQKKLNEFYNNKEFSEDFKKIMEHDKHKHNYLFHGTQDLESAESIINEGLGMMRKDLSSTTYSEFTMDDVILYSRGFGGAIGKDAIVIIDQPINEDGEKENIVEENNKTREMHFIPSGLQGLDGKPKYLVDSKYIIGYINKRDKQVIYNPKYYDYNKFKNEKRNEFIESLKVNIEKTNQGKEDKKPEIVSQEEKSIEDDL